MKEVKKMYERPTMNRILVQIEDGFIAASGDPIVGDKNTKVSIDRQGGFDDGDIEISGWE